MNNFNISQSSNSDSSFAVTEAEPRVVGKTFIEDILPTVDKNVRKRFILQPPVNIFNIPFAVTKNVDGYVLSNNRWQSLSGFGNSLQDAIESASQTIVDAIENYLYESEDNLTEDAIEFRKYLLTKLSA